MLGKEIRGIRHLFRYCQGNLVKIFMTLDGNNNIIEGMAITVDDKLYILNNEMHNTKGADSHMIMDLMRQHNFGYVIVYSKSSLDRFDEYRTIIKQIIALPDKFDEEYSEFLNSNKKALSPVTSKIGFETLKSNWCRYLYMMTGNSKNFFLWAVMSRIRGVTIHAIIEALRWNDNYQQMAKNLKKGTITAYTNFKDIIELLKEQSVLRRSKRVNDTINMFNTKQKKVLREFADNEKAYQIMSKFRRLSDTKQNNFIRKMSTIEDAAEIMKQMSFVADAHFSWSKKDLLEYLQNNDHLSYKLVVDNGPVVLVEVKDFDTVKRLAKNTNWCISKNKQYWNNYMSQGHIDSGTKQYVLFDFDKQEDDVRSIVGFTINAKKGITASHDYVNNNILDNKINMTQYFRRKFHTLVPSKASNGGIHALLASKGIDVSTLLPNDKPEFLWNCDDFIAFLNERLGNDDNYDILSMEDNKLAILVETNRIAKVLGGNYVTRVPRELWSNEHILFANFNCDPDSADRLIFAIISYDNSTKEAYCQNIMNIQCDSVPVSFDEMLGSFGLPYDIICRSDVLTDKIYSAFSNYDLNSLKTLLNEHKDKISYDYDDAVEIADSIRRTMLLFLTDEFLKVIYESGHTMSEIVGTDVTFDTVVRLLSPLNNISNDDLTDDDFSRMFEHDKSLSTNKAEYVALCHMFKYIYEHENEDLKKRINNHVKLHSNISKYVYRLTNGGEPMPSKSKSKSSSLGSEFF